MNKVPLIIIGAFLVAAILYIGLSTSNDSTEFDVAQTPTDISQISPTANKILGEETQEIPNVSTATIETSKGEIVIELFSDAAPNTVRSFAEKSRNKFYENLTFHRVEDWVIQGGDPLGNGTGGGQIPTELNNNPFIRGSVGVARGGDVSISNDSQFFITKSSAPWLDQLYTNFGQVSGGLDVVDRLQIGDLILSISVE